MKSVIALAVALLLNATAWAEEFRLFSPLGVGPLDVKSEVEKSGKGSWVRATATNDSGVPIRNVHFCVRNRKSNVCAATLGNIEIWQPGAAFYAEVNLPASAKLGSYVIDVALLVPDKGIYHVRRIYAEKVEGKSRDVARDQLMALIVNTGLFTLVGDSKIMETLVVGQFEVLAAFDWDSLVSINFTRSSSGAAGGARWDLWDI
jgi:hypothetical protein